MGKTNTPEFTLAYETTEPHGFMIDLEELLARFALGSAAEIDALIAQWQTFNIGMLGFMQNHDLIICTVTPTQAVLRGTTFDDDVLPRFSYTAAFNVTGWLSAVVRSGSSQQGVPIGVQCVAGPWAEHTALAGAGIIESELGGFQRPDMS